MVIITLASTSEIKRNAVEKVFARVYDSIEMVVKCVDTQAIVKTPPQPFNEQGSEAVNQRMNALSTVSAWSTVARSNWLVAIENAIVTERVEDGSERWKDVCHVLIRLWDQTKTSERVFSATSFAIDIPPHIVDAYREAVKTNAELTLGMVADSENPSNWMLKRCGIDRGKQIRDALECCLLSSYVTFVDDFPKPGVCFQDLSVILEHRRLLPVFTKRLVRFAKRALEDTSYYTHIVGLDARGFIYGPLLAGPLSCGFVMARKAGKLPRSPGDAPLVSHTYTTEYSSDTVEMLPGLLGPGDRVVIVDDLVATGGSLAAARALVEKCGARVECAICILGVQELAQVARANFDLPIHVFLN